MNIACMPILLNPDKHRIATSLDKFGFSKKDFRTEEKEHYFKLTHGPTKLSLIIEHGELFYNCRFSQFHPKNDITPYKEQSIEDICLKIIPMWARNIQLAMEDSKLSDPWS